LRWRQLHKLTYAIALLGCLHYLMQVRGLRIEAIVYTLLILGLLLTRMNLGGRGRA
jgi:sulfoxide reductase heme-binding subunit YedZ